MYSYDDLLLQIEKLKKENSELKRILKKHNIDYSEILETKTLAVEDKIKIYSEYFKGRTDAFTERYFINDKKRIFFSMQKQRQTKLFNKTRNIKTM